MTYADGLPFSGLHSLATCIFRCFVWPDLRGMVAKKWQSYVSETTPEDPVHPFEDRDIFLHYPVSSLGSPL
jgi:hypothetical protein